MRGLKGLIRAGKGKNKVIRRPGQPKKLMSPGVPGGMGTKEFDRRITSENSDL